MARTRLWVGLDVGADETVVCGIDDEGNVIFEQAASTKGSAVHALLRPRKRSVGLIALEAGSFGIFLTRSLRKLGYPVAVFDSRQASKFLAIRQNKTDKNDARGLADIARLGRTSVSQVFVKSPEFQRLKSTLVTRQKLVRLRMALESNMRSLFRLNGGRLKSSSSASTLSANVTSELRRLRRQDKVDLRADMEPLLTLSQSIRVYVERLDRELARQADEIPICRRFQEIDGVGPFCALSFYAAIEEPDRFRRNTDVGPYLGMVPRTLQTGHSTVRRRISKMGDQMTRTYLVNAALAHLRYGDTALAAWGKQVASRCGKRRAQIAVGRKLAITMLAMWRSNEPFDALRGLNPKSSEQLTV